MEDIGHKHSKMAILAKNGQILTIFGHFGGQKFFSTEKNLGGHLSHMETQLHAKNQKKYQAVKAVGPELTHVHTYVRTYESEFIGSFRSLKTSREPIRTIHSSVWKL